MSNYNTLKKSYCNKLIFLKIFLICFLFLNFYICEIFSAKIEFDFTTYQDYSIFKNFIYKAKKKFPSIVEVKSIGTSHEGRKLLGLKIDVNNKTKNKKGIWIDGGNHAREWPAFHVAVYFIQKLLNGYNNDDVITSYLNQLIFYIFPVLNPDGFVFSRSSSKSKIRQWRKNRAPVNCTNNIFFKNKTICCEGVDLNRNWDVEFSQKKYPFNYPCSDEYQGPKPFSEPETRAMYDYVRTKEISENVKAMISLHTHGQLIILPYSYKKNTYPEDFDDLYNLAIKAAAAIKSVQNTTYKVGTGADLFNPVTGSALDWIKKNTKIKYIYVIELPPDLSRSFAYQVQPHFIDSIAKETWKGVEVIIEQVIQEFEL